MAASATLALKPGVWFRRGRLLIVSPDSLGTACPLSGRNSTYRLVQILEAGSAGSVCPTLQTARVAPFRLVLLFALNVVRVAIVVKHVSGDDTAIGLHVIDPEFFLIHLCIFGVA